VDHKLADLFKLTKIRIGLSSTNMNKQHPNSKAQEIQQTIYLSGHYCAGRKIWNEHIKVSSTDIIAPALSNSPQ